jgi:hypothetical protein
VVIAADTREVWANLSKRNAQKIHVHGFKDALTYVVSAAGHGDLMQMFVEDLDREVWKAMDQAMAAGDNWVNVDDIARSVVRELFDNHIAPFASFPSDQRPEHYALIGVQAFDKNYPGHGSSGLSKIAPPYTLIEIHDRIAGGPHAAIGIGMFLADSLLERFHPKRMDVETTADLAVYILKHVKAVVQDCDGFSDIVLQRNDGTVDMLDPIYINELESWYREIDQVATDIFLATIDPSLPLPVQMDRCLQFAQQKPKQVRQNALI